VTRVPEKICFAAFSDAACVNLLMLSIIGKHLACVYVDSFCMRVKFLVKAGPCRIVDAMRPKFGSKTLSGCSGSLKRFARKRIRKIDTPQIVQWKYGVGGK